MFKNKTRRKKKKKKNVETTILRRVVDEIKSKVESVKKKINASKHT